MKSYKFSNNLFLNILAVPKATTAAPPPPQGINHLFWFDVSGSMYGNLPSIRTQIKNKLATLVGIDDTVTLGWFSGRNECGVIIEGAKVSDVAQLTKLQQAVDRYLQCVGLTGFKDPLVQSKELAKRLAANGNPISLFFLSDGYHNDGPPKEVLTAAEQLAPLIGAATVVEYGYYADRPMLTAIAERLGGTLVFAQNFNDYEAVVGKAVGARPEGKKIALNIPSAVGDMVFGLKDGSIPTFAVKDGAVLVDMSLNEVAFLSETSNTLSPIDFVGNDEEMKPILPFAYAATALMATRMQPTIVKGLLRGLGDVKFIEQFGNCFGKQAYSQFTADVTEAVYLPVKRVTDGYDPTKVPADDVFTVLDLINLLASDEDNRILLKSPEFKYSKISRGRLDANTVLTDAEMERVAVLTDQISSTKDLKSIMHLTAQINAITDKPGPIKFVENEGDGDDGYPVSALTYNESRPNVSVLITRNGHLDLSGQKDRPAGVPEKYPMTTFRNYSIITDGLVNVDVLPLKLSENTQKELRKLAGEGRLPAGVFTAKGAVVDGKFKESVISANLLKLPVINSLMVKGVKLEDLVREELALLKMKAEQKVVNGLITEKTGSRTSSVGLVEKYGAEGAAWLKEKGITDRGFSPKSVQAESTDFYMSKEIDVKLKGLSSLPTLAKTREGGKNAGVVMMAAALKDNESKSLEVLQKEQDVVRKAVRAKIAELAKTKFSIIVGQTWFADCASLDENELEITDGGHTYTCTAVLSEKEVKI